MPALSVDQVTYIRAHPHMVKFYLAPIVPNTVLSARVNDPTIAQGARTIIYTFVSGNWANVKAGQTLFVGQAAGWGDKGRVRVKSATVNAIVVAENSHIDWKDGDYLWIGDTHEPWPVYPRFELAAGAESMEIAEDCINLWKDYDLVYDHQNEHYYPVAVMGPPAVGAMTGTPTPKLTVYFDGSSSYGLNGATIASYSWVFPSGTPATSAAATPGNVYWTVAGTYIVSLEVTDSNGEKHTGYRAVRVFDGLYPGSGIFPFTEFEISSLSGDYGSGTWRAQVTVRDLWGRLSGDVFQDNMQVLIFAEGQAGQGGATIPISTAQPNRSNLLFVGWCVGESIRKDSETNDVSFEIDGICGRMSKIDMFSNFLETPPEVRATKYWWEAENLCADLAIAHQLRWHSTIFDITDVFLTNTYVQKRTIRQTFAAGNLYGQCDQVMQAMVGRMLSDKYSCIYCRIDPMVLPTSDRLGIPSVMTLTDADWGRELSITRRHLDDVSRVSLGGFYHDGGTDPEINAVPLLSLAPGTTPRYEGSLERIEGMILEGQAQANQLSGDILAWRDNPYPSIQMSMNGSYTFFDFAPPEWVIWSLAASATKRGISWILHRFIPRAITIQCNNPGGFAQVNVDLEKETDGLDGITGMYPPTEAGTPPEPEAPATPPAPTTPEGGEGAWRNHVVCCGDLGVYYTETFSAVNPVWNAWTTGMSEVDTRCLAFHPLTPESCLYAATEQHVYKATSLGGAWSPILHAHAISGTNPKIYTIQTNPCAPNDIYAIVWTGPLYGMGGSQPKLWFYASHDQGASWDTPVQVNNQPFRYDSTAGVSSVTTLQVQSVDPGNDLYFSAKDSWAGCSLYFSADRGATWTYVAGSRDAGSFTQYYQSHIDGRLWKHKREGGVDKIFRSDDHGTSWAEQAAFVYNNSPGKHWFNAQMVQAGLCRVADMGSLYKTLDYGDNWVVASDVTTIVPINIELVPDAVNKLYLSKNGAANVSFPDTVWSSEDEGVTRFSKSGANANIVNTGGGDSIPYNNRMRDLTPIWTLP